VGGTPPSAPPTAARGGRGLFSARLDWQATENRLAEREAARRAADRPVLDLTVTNPTQVGLSYPGQALANALGDAGVASYEPAPFGASLAREAVAADFARRGAAVAPDAIALTASSSESYALLFKLLCNPGDAVLVPQPSYPLFEYLARLEGVEPRPYRLTYDGRWRLDFDSLALEGARALCVVNPNNPTGSFLSRDEWARLSALAASHDLPLIVDEVFADYALSPAVDAAVTVAALPASALTFCLGGLSKAAGLPQMKLGWIAAAGPPALTAEALRRLELVCDTYLSVGTPVQRALPALLAAGADLRGQITQRVQVNRQRLATTFGRSSPCTLLPAEAGWSAILRVPAVMSDEDWALTLIDRDGVLVQPGYFFDLEVGTTLVLSLLTHPATLAEGARRIADRVGAI
jgi:alanine-synthesizing transaminase